MESKIKNPKQNSSTPKNKTTRIALTVIAAALIIGMVYFIYNNMGSNSGVKPGDKTAELESYLKENYSKYVIDGSTSLIPLHEALDKKFGAGNEIKHSKTVAAFEDFLDGKIDILLSVDYLQSYFDKAKEKGIEINKNEITKEALVFLKNVDLTIDNLTLEQIRQIYTKKITDWTEIDKNYKGNVVTDIVPIYRNEDSGSGMALINLLGLYTISCSQNDCVFISDMGAVVNALANGLEEGFQGAMIAFNMYTFTEKQYHNDRVANFKIDGVEPNDETIYNEEYPIILYNYIYYKNDEAKEFGEKLYEYLISDAGQKLIMESGYVPLRKQEGVEISDATRNCKTHFVDEVCVMVEGYNEDIGKYVKITFDNKTEKYEYFDKVEEYIFANSDVTRAEFDKLSGLLGELILMANDENLETQRITFKKQKNGEIILDTGFCGGTACIWLATDDAYDFGENDPKVDGESAQTNTLTISKDLKTISCSKWLYWGLSSDNDFSLVIPIEDFTLALRIEGL